MVGGLEQRCRHQHSDGDADIDGHGPSDEALSRYPVHTTVAPETARKVSATTPRKGRLDESHPR